MDENASVSSRSLIIGAKWIRGGTLPIDGIRTERYSQSYVSEDRLSSMTNSINRIHWPVIFVGKIDKHLDWQRVVSSSVFLSLALTLSVNQIWNLYSSSVKHIKENPCSSSLSRHCHIHETTKLIDVPLDLNWFRIGFSNVSHISTGFTMRKKEDEIDRMMKRSRTIDKPWFKWRMWTVRSCHLDICIIIRFIHLRTWFSTSDNTTWENKMFGLTFFLENSTNISMIRKNSIDRCTSSRNSRSVFLRVSNSNDFCHSRSISSLGGSP